MTLKINNTIVEFTNKGIKTKDKFLKKQVLDLMDLVEMAPQEGFKFIEVLKGVFSDVKVIKPAENLIY